MEVNGNNLKPYTYSELFDSLGSGLGYVNAVCGALQYRIAISEYYYEDMTSAEVWPIIRV